MTTRIQVLAATLLLITLTTTTVPLHAGTISRQSSPNIPDLARGPIQPYNIGYERQRFLNAAGRDLELTATEFSANQKTPKPFARKFDRWSNLIRFDKNKNKTIDWFEALAYRNALKNNILAIYDKNRDHKLKGQERIAANIALAKGRIPSLSTSTNPWRHRFQPKPHKSRATLASAKSDPRYISPHKPKSSKPSQAVFVKTTPQIQAGYIKYNGAVYHSKGNVHISQTKWHTQSHQKFNTQVMTRPKLQNTSPDKPVIVHLNARIDHQPAADTPVVVVDQNGKAAPQFAPDGKYKSASYVLAQQRNNSRRVILSNAAQDPKFKIQIQHARDKQLRILKKANTQHRAQFLLRSENK